MRNAAGRALLIGLGLILADSVWAFEMHVDARGLTSTAFLLQDITPPTGSTGILDGTVVQTLDLAEGAYILQPGSGIVMSCTLFVTVAGAWDYDGGCDGFLAGRGTDTLAVAGYPINVDARPLSNTGIYMANLFGGTLLDAEVVQPMTLVPAEPAYAIQPGSGVVCACAWGIDRDGQVTYAPALEGLLTGGGSDTVVIHGHAINIDATALSADGFVLPSLFGLELAPPLDAAVVQPLTVVPVGGGYAFQTGSGSIGNFAWNVDSSGLITYSPLFDSYLSGRGTTTLHVLGHALEIDATALGPGFFQVFHIFGAGTLDRSSVQTLQLMPTIYRFYAPPIDFPFTLQDGGTIDYDPALDFCILGRGTSRLTVLCDPAAPPTPEELIADLQSTIQGLPPSAFRNGNANLARALVNKLDAVLAQLAAARAETDGTVQDQLFQDAIDKLQNDILAKTNGCAASGSPDANDWIVDCAVQADLSFQINRIIMAIQALI